MNTRRFGLMDVLWFATILFIATACAPREQPTQAQPSTDNDVSAETVAMPESDVYNIPDLKPFVFETVPADNKYHNPHPYKVVLRCDNGSTVSEATIDAQQTHEGFNGACIIWRIGE